MCFLRYHKQKILRTPRYMLTKRLQTFFKKERFDIYINAIEAKKFSRYLGWNLVDPFECALAPVYDFKRCKIRFDSDKKMWFVYTSEGRKLYFRRDMSRKKVLHQYRFLEKEQDPSSPHYYFFDGLELNENSVVADIGTAEGNFGLKIIDKIKALYLFECEPEWIEALEATFEPWKGKVHIVNRFVSDKTEGDAVRLDDFFKDKALPSVVKMDVEGAEASVLTGAAAFLQEKRISDLLVCTYHRKEDAENLSAMLQNFGYHITFSQGYMFFGEDEPLGLRFRRGLLHARG